VRLELSRRWARALGRWQEAWSTTVGSCAMPAAGASSAPGWRAVRPSLSRSLPVAHGATAAAHLADPIAPSLAPAGHCQASYDLCTPCLLDGRSAEQAHNPAHVFVALKRAVDWKLHERLTRSQSRRPRGLLEVDLYA